MYVRKFKDNLWEKVMEFGEIKKSEEVIKETWSEFREKLVQEQYELNDIDKVKECTFLKVYDGIFNQNSGFNYKITTIGELQKFSLGRGTILNETESIDYERFIPKKEFINQDNRFSPSGIEWLYLAIGNETEIHQCAQAECRVNIGDRFGFCHFNFDSRQLNLKLVDLTISDNISYDDLNNTLEQNIKIEDKKRIKIARMCGKDLGAYWHEREVKRLFIKWSVYTYAKLLSEQIFQPICDEDDRSIMYAPFQVMAQYYISLGYCDIIYGSTVSEVGRNIVLFDKSIAHPAGSIENYIIEEN